MSIQGLNQMVSAYQKITDTQQKAEKERKEEAARKADGQGREQRKEAGQESARYGDSVRYGESAIYTRSEESASLRYENMMMSFTATYRQTEQQEAEEANALEEARAAKEAASAPRNAEDALSDKAKAYLQTLRERYGNMDFIIADYSSEAEAQALLASGHGSQYNVLIDPETLEKMAEDEEIRAKYEDILNNAGKTFDAIKEELGEDADYVKQLGISVDSNGKVTYYSIIDESLKGSAERLKKQQETKKEKKAEEKKKEEKAEEKKKAERAEEKEKAERAEQKRKAEERYRPGHPESGSQGIRVESDNPEDFLAKIREVIAGFQK